MRPLSPNTTSHTLSEESTSTHDTARIFRPVDLDVEEVRHEYLDRILAGFYSLAGGVIFGTVFIDIIPHIQTLEEKYKFENAVEQAFPNAPTRLEIMRTNGRRNKAKKNEKLDGRSEKKSANVAIAALTFIFAMSIQGFIEGITLLQNTTSRIVELLMALILAKLVAGLTAGREKEARREKIVAIITAIIVFALVIPFGSALGSFIDRYEITEAKQDGITLIFESLAGGIFIYVALIEIIHKQKRGDDRILHLWIIFFGATLVGILHLSFGTIILRAAGGDEETDYPELFTKIADDDE